MRKIKSDTVRKKVIALIIPVLAALIYILKDFFITLGDFLPPCVIHYVTGYYCPGCGNTRSVTALLHGDIIASLHNNVTPLVILILCLGFYIEYVFSAFGKDVKILPRSKWVIIVFSILMISYFILRNFIPQIAPTSA